MVIRRAVLAGVVGALAAALSLVAAYFMHPGLEFEMDRALPSFVTGFQGTERDPQGSFSWTSGHVLAEIPGLDRQVEWSCTLRFRGSRPGSDVGPILAVSVDGGAAKEVPSSRDYQEYGIILPPQANAVGASISMTVTPTFVPGGADTRTLGVQVDRFVCRPSSPLVRPPTNTLSNAALATAIFAAGLALVGLSLSSAMFAAAAIGLGQTVMLAIGSGMYGTYSATLPWLSLCVVFTAFIIARSIELARPKPLSSSARFVIAAAASVMFLKLIGLFHPAKPIIDALFHAHRLEWVLQGRYYFEQPMPDGVTFPYAIGLYVFAAPWAWLTSDHVALIRTATVASEVIAGALMYPVVLAVWGDRRAAALASVLYQLAPLPLAVLANANLTNLFGQSVALATMMAAVGWSLDTRRYRSFIGFVVIATWALCSHVSTITTLSATLGVLAILYWWRGDEARRRSAIAIVLGTALAAVLAWIVYYGHFTETYRTAYTQMFAAKTAAASTEVVKGNMDTAGRVRDMLLQFRFAYGLPLLFLAAVGTWSLALRRQRDRLVSALFAWSVVWLVFSASTVFAPVGDKYVRYSAEFLGRVNLATLPLIAILAARGAAFGWEPDPPAYLRQPLQVFSVLMLAWVLFNGLNSWLGWF